MQKLNNAAKKVVRPGFRLAATVFVMVALMGASLARPHGKTSFNQPTGNRATAIAMYGPVSLPAAAKIKAKPKASTLSAPSLAILKRSQSYWGVNCTL